MTRDSHHEPADSFTSSFTIKSRSGRPRCMSGRVGTSPIRRKRSSSGGNGFLAAGAIAALETTLMRPVLTSNQVLLWILLAHAATQFEVSGYGRLSHTQRRPPTCDARLSAGLPTEFLGDGQHPNEPADIPPSRRQSSLIRRASARRIVDIVCGLSPLT
jgi:hypothetical protein